ncbi:UPF0602 protein C4orf47 homolog isoform X2 [Protopterus annectens]|nr:UPF0602 protein C4orf47 homolog isoform X2 [Protopterus annectens]
MMSTSTKVRSALQTGYFEPQFSRIFEGESYSNPMQLRRQYRLQQAKKNIGKAFLPSNGEKKPSGLGNFYGTLSGPIPALSAASKPKQPYSSPKKNLFTNPPKHGTGYGYPNLTIGKQYEYSTDPYDRIKELSKKELETHKKLMKAGSFYVNMHPKDYFEGNPYKSDRPLPPPKRIERKHHDVKPFKPSSPPKMVGGMKAGTFDPYPSHSNDPYIIKRSKSSSQKGVKAFHPSPGQKSTLTHSIVSANVIKAVNPINYRTVQSVMAY